MYRPIFGLPHGQHGNYTLRVGYLVITGVQNINLYFHASLAPEGCVQYILQDSSQPGERAGLDLQAQPLYSARKDQMLIYHL
jgi:hypothetical protein